MSANVLNMVRAALYSISFFGFLIFKFTNSFSVKKKLRHGLYLLGIVVVISKLILYGLYSKLLGFIPINLSRISIPFLQLLSFTLQS